LWKIQTIYKQDVGIILRMMSQRFET
jgi:hypothetical protein